MDDLQDLSFQDLMKKMTELQEIEARWRENKNIDDVRRSIKNLELPDLDYLADHIDDSKSLIMVLRLFFYKIFGVLNMRVKDLIMSYQSDPSKLQELQGELSKILNLDLSSLNPFGGFSEDKPEEKTDEKKPDKGRTLN